ncbi:DUF6779 domain-containing protein [Corynebacterium sp. NPDC060344]|uniref:DUF6779 domain-containing protein n=1 Tax=Corynebacterium sp. NPDC060344 TaxID=3347101 RepID=UPI003653ED13
MTQPEDFDVDRNGQDRDVAESGHVEQWDERAEGTAGQARPAATGDGDATDKVATAMMVALIALAVVASVVMLFTDSTGWMKIAVLAGLWAAVIGALLVTRYRRQLAAERERIADLEVMHGLELDRELATHREQELILEQNYLDSLDARSDDTIMQLRAEIVALREHLAEMLGADLDEERIALRARAERLRELDAPAASPLKDPESHQRPKPRATAHRAAATANGVVGTHTNHGPHGLHGADGADLVDGVGDVDGHDEHTVAGVPEEWDENEAFEARGGDDREPVDVPVVDNGVPGHTYGGGFNTGSFKAVPWQEAEGETDAHATEKAEKAETKAQYRPHPDAAESRPTAVLPRIDADAQARAEAEAEEKAGAETSTDAAETAGFPKVDAHVADAEHAAGDHAETADTTDATGTADTADTADDDAASGSGRRSRHGRRRAEDHEGGLTVAELLAQMRARNGSGE